MMGEAEARGQAAPLLSVRDLQVHFPIHRGVLQRTVGFVRAVDGVSFDLMKGETLGLVGESGCGKSTTGRAIIQLQRSSSGSVLFQGRDLTRMRGAELRRMRRQFQMIFQDPFSSLDPRMTVGRISGEPLRVHAIGTRTEQHHRIKELLEMVGLDPNHATRFPHEFSGGQRQRIGIARALATSVSLIVCDEPVSALDVSIQAQIVNLLRELQDDLGLSYVFIAHDLSVVRHIADRVAVMYLGRIVEIGRRDSLFQQPAHPYTRALLSAVPVPEPTVEKSRRRIVLGGDVPSPADPPRGCRFHPRCWLREQLGRPDECISADPQLRVVGDGQRSACHFSEQMRAGDMRASWPASAASRQAAGSV